MAVESASCSPASAQLESVLTVLAAALAAQSAVAYGGEKIDNKLVTVTVSTNIRICANVEKKKRLPSVPAPIGGWVCGSRSVRLASVYSDPHRVTRSSLACGADARDALHNLLCGGTVH